MILKLYDKENTYTFNVDDLNRGEKLYYKFQFTTANVANGKYNMVLTDDVGNVITEDVVCIGDFNAETIQYNRGENVYINSPLNANLEDVRTITIDVPSYTVYPSEGYDAMKEVVVDAQPVYDNGYNAGNADGYEQGNIAGYENGFVAGNETGYANGVEEGKTTQKALLEPITITENGTYSREDGYSSVTVNVEDTNGSYDVGYSEGYQAGIEDGTANAGEIIGETARVLNITENGTYTSEYSQWVDYPKPEQVTGVFDDGKEFYNEAYPKGIVYRTNDFIITPQTKIELWFKPVNYNWTTDYFSLDVREIGNDFKLRVYGVGSTKNSFEAKIGNCSVYIDLTELEYKKMHHIVMSFVDGFWLDGVKVGDFEGNFTIKNSSYSFEINPSAANIGGASNYGMFKIDDVVIIPTEDGFLNVNTNELLTYTNVSTEPQYTYYNNFTEPVAEGNLIRTVNVDVIPKIDVAATGLRFGYSTFTEVPSWADFSNTTDMTGMFNSCSKLQSFPQIDTSNVLKMMNLFYGCSSLQTIPLIDTSKVTIMEALFAQCTSLITIPQLDTRSVQNMHQMFYYCTSLTSIPPLKADKLNMPETYRGIFGISELTKLTDFGGLIGLKCRLIGDYNFNRLPNLTYQSCINILNGLYDFTGNGETPASNQGQLKVHPNFLNLVGDEISIGVAKGWQISA